MGLSVPALVLSAMTTDHVAPKSVDLATAISLLPFCSQEAYTVRPSIGSTTICASHWRSAAPARYMIVGAAHVAPRLLLICKIIVGLSVLQVEQPGTPPYCGYRRETG